MNSNDVEAAKQRAKQQQKEQELSPQEQKLRNDIKQNKEQTSQLENRNKDLEQKTSSFSGKNASIEERNQFGKDSQELKANTSKIQTNKQELPQKQEQLKALELKRAGTKAQGHEATKQTKGQVLEASEGTGKMTNTNQSIPAANKEGYAGMQRGKVHSTDQARLAALRDKGKIPQQNKQPNSPLTQQAKDKAKENQSKPKEQQQTQSKQNEQDNER